MTVPASYEMFTVAGDQAVEIWLKGIEADIDAGRIKRSDLVAALVRGFEQIVALHPEAEDTAAREAIAEAVESICDREGWIWVNAHEYM